MTSIYRSRVDRVRAAMAVADVEAVILSVGRDLPFLTGYEAMPLERLTLLVIPRGEHATLLIPGLEAPRVDPLPDVFTVLPWTETEDPVALAAKVIGDRRRIAVGDQMWARFLVELLPHLPGATFVRANGVVGSLRLHKDAAEIAALQSAGAAVDRIATQLQSGQIPLIGRTEAEVSADLSARILGEGHEVVNFAIVAAGENAASPHHHPGPRVIGPNEIVLCDFGGTMAGYCSDITRCVTTGDVDPEIHTAYAVLKEAQAAAVAAAQVGATCESVDAAARDVISAAGYGEYFVHRTGHGIGMEAHEDPYIVSGNTTILEHGHAFSIEPGIYIPGRWGMRLEDIVIATERGPLSANNADHDLALL